MSVSQLRHDSDLRLHSLDWTNSCSLKLLASMRFSFRFDGNTLHQAHLLVWVIKVVNLIYRDLNLTVFNEG